MNKQDKIKVHKALDIERRVHEKLLIELGLESRVLGNRIKELGAYGIVYRIGRHEFVIEVEGTILSVDLEDFENKSWEDLEELEVLIENIDYKELVKSLESND